MDDPKPGDIFSFPVKNGELGFGRVMLNIQTQCISSGKIDDDNPLRIHQDVVLVEIYSQTSEGDMPDSWDVLIPGILTHDDWIKRGMWKTVGSDKVDPHGVEFPEGLSIETVSTAALIRGELALPLEMKAEKVDAIGIHPGTKAGWIFGAIVLYHLGREDEIDVPRLNDTSKLDLANYDLRFSEHRSGIYAQLGEDADESYYELSKRKGFDLARFYE